jgi:site-specific DNA-cytosine methylase
MQGGHREPKIAHPAREVGRRLDENGKRCDDNKDIPITRRYEIGEKEISNCLSGVQKDSYVATKENIDSKHIFRKLTERECFRLQGFNDSFIFPPKISSTQLYKQAGNGMSRNILDMIFTQIFKSKNFDLSSNS